MFAKLTQWLTPDKRKAIYNVCVAVFALGIVAGWILPEQVERFEAAILTSGGLVALLTNLLASKNVNTN